MTTTILCWALILLTPIDWWAVIVHHQALRRHPGMEGSDLVRRQGQWFTLTALAATFVAAIAINYLLGMPVPIRGLAFGLLAAALLLLSAHPALFVLNHYRRR